MGEGWAHAHARIIYGKFCKSVSMAGGVSITLYSSKIIRAILRARRCKRKKRSGGCKHEVNRVGVKIGEKKGEKKVRKRVKGDYLFFTNLLWYNKFFIILRQATKYHFKFI